MEFLDQHPPRLLERDHESVTIAWSTPRNPVKHYELEMTHERDDDHWSVVSSTLKHNVAKKKHLNQALQYRFRVRYEDLHGNWSHFSAPSEPVQPLASEVRLTTPPTLLAAESNAITVQWEEIPAATGYHLRFRREDELSWHEVEAEIKGNRAKKKGLTHGHYYFTVKPIVPGQTWDYGSSGGPFATIQIHPYFQRIFPSKLWTIENGKMKEINLSEIAGKTIGLYFSAHWCGPCRNFTPQLATLYQQAKAANKKFEIVFCSCDHSDNEFRNYFTGSMPWKAIDFDDSKREEILGMFRVSGIPKLTILSPSGRVIEDNATHHQLNLAKIDEWTREV